MQGDCQFQKKVGNLDLNINMFESLVATILNRFLGSYIENFDPKQLNIGIWNGDVKLRNLKLKKESLDKFNLPLDAKFGHLGELTLQIPWANLKGKPVSVVIEDVYLLVAPILQDNYDPEEEKKRDLQVKREKVENLDLLEQEIKTNLTTNESFTESLITKIVDNLQITIKNIHIRYEDDSTLTEDPYSVGITLNELSATSTDESWIPSFIAITQQFTRKLLRLKNLSCYMNTDSESIYVEGDDELLLSRFKQSFSKNTEDFQYLLKPVSGDGKITVHKAGTTELAPHVKAELFFQEFGIELDSQQYRDLLWTASKFHWYIKTQKFRRFRPKVSVSEDPKAWFRYSIQSILNEIHEKNQKWSWEYFKKRRDQRKLYIILYKQRLTEREELEKLEDVLTFEEIKFYRSIARTQLREEKPKQIEAPPAAEQKAGWFSYVWGTAPPAESDLESSESDLKLTEDQRKALYEAIEYDESVVNSIDVPRDRVTMEIHTSLKRGGICIKNKDKSNLAEVVFEGCTAQFYERPDSFLAKFQLQEFRVEDGTGTTLYKHIVSVKQLHSAFHEQVETEEPFFHISFENNPLDESADSILLGKLKSMTIFYNPKFIEEIVKFFKPPKMHLDTIGAIMNAAEGTMESITEQTRIGLQYALEEHKTINVKLDLQAPLIILPLDPSNFKSPVAILDAGHISVISDLVDKKKIEEIKAKENYTSVDWEELNTLMYDKFDLHLQDAQFLVGQDIKSTMMQLHNVEIDRPALILDKLNIKLRLGISILPEAHTLAKFKISGEVPSVQLMLNDFQYKTLMKIIDVVIPDLDDLDNDDDSIFNTFGGGPVRAVEFESGKDETPKELKTTAISKEAAAQQIFQFSLDVKSLKVSLSRCIDPITLQAEHMADLIGDSLDLFFYKTETDLHVDLSVADINLIDFLDKSGVTEFEKVISSNYFHEDDNHKSANKKVFKLDYLKSQRIVQFNGKEIEVFDQDINVDIATLKFVLSPKSYLSIMNFILNTFTDPNAEATPADELKHNDKRKEQSPEKINVNVNLDSIILAFNEDGIKLATLQLSTANIKVFLVPEEMDVSGVLGALTLHDETNHGSPRDSFMRNLINIEGDNLAEFRYRTFDNETNKNPYNTTLDLKTGSLCINFVESSFNRIYAYLSQFLKMKAIYDRTREAAINQAQINIQDTMKFDLLLKAPTIVFPRAVNGYANKFDIITARLGELKATNEFVVSDLEGDTRNIISAGVRNISLQSKLNFLNDIEQIGEIASNLDILFEIDVIESKSLNESGPPQNSSIKISGKTPEINLNLTELQLNALYKLSDSISHVFEIPEVEDDFEDIKEEAVNANAVIKHNNSPHKTQEEQAIELVQAQEELEEESVKSADLKESKNKLSFKFDIPKMSLVIYNNTTGLDIFTTKKFACFSLNEFGVKFDMNEDDHFVANVTAHSFTVEDVRDGTVSKYTQIIPSISSKDDQFVLTASTAGPQKTITVMLTVDNPKTIVALDYIFELQSFVNKGFQVERAIDYEEDAEDTKQVSTTSDSKIGFSINIKEPSIMLLEDPSKIDTLAVVFKVEQLLITSQNVTSLAANNIGMFMTQMNDFDENQYRIIDDFSLSFAYDDRGSNSTSFLTNVQASIDPILLRVSLRDIRLAIKIFNKASDLFNKSNPKNGTEDTDYRFSEDFKRRLSQYAPSILTELSLKSKKDNGEDEKIVIKGEEFNASIGGVRFVLIGDVHELPIVDMMVSPFEIRAINWSTDLSAEAHVELFINIYNYSKSTWEPLIEPWPIAVYASKTLLPKPSIVIDVVSRQLAEVTLTSRSLALMSQIFNSIDDEIKPIGNDNPYKIVNETGYSVEVWVDREDRSSPRTLIQSNQTIPWAFEDWREIRENLDSNNKIGVLGVKLVDSSYEEVRNISVTSEGEDLFMLFPPVKGVHNRLSCEIILGSDNIKTILLRSTIVVRNDSDVAIIVKMSEKIEITIKSMHSQALPIDLVYSGGIRIKPLLEEASYDWSNEMLTWKDLLKEGSHLRCSSSNPSDDSSFHFQAEADYDKNEPLTKIYPHMKLVISSPVEIENLLPFDLNYRLYDKKARKDWNGHVDKGSTSIVHVVNLKNLLLLSIEPINCGFGKSEFAIINSPHSKDFKRESTFTLRHENGQELHLKVHYPKLSRASLKIVIYSPYIVLNRTDQNIVVSEKGNMMYGNSSREVSNTLGLSNQKITDAETTNDYSTPLMFSFDIYGDRQNRALVKVADSAWSTPLSFDAIGQVIAVRAISGRKEINFGVSVAEGEGKYNLTKVVTIAPRYLFNNNLDETIQILENGSTQQFDIAPGELKPIYGFRRTEKKNFLLKFAHSSKSWSSPFALDDIGRVYLKVFKEDIGQILLQVNILIENSTIFIQIESANNHWPFSIRNFSESEFYIYQSNPNINENGDVVKSDTDYKPIYYKIPAKSVMPYAYDYPNAVIKELIIRSNGRERGINLQEIGNLKPFRLPSTDDADQKIIDLNVVADGPTQSLIITNYDPSVSLYKLQDKSATLNFEATESDENYHTKIITKFEGFGISLINTRSLELCYITLRGLEIRYNESDLYQNLSLKLKWIQIDNQLYGGIFPIVLYPSVIPKSGKEMNNHPSFSASVCKVKDDSHGVLFLKYATVLLQEMTLEIDEDFLFALIDFAKLPGASWNKEQVDKLCDANLELPEPETLSNSSDVYFEALHLQPILANLSFVRTERLNAEEKTSSQNTLMFFFNVLTMAMGNINDAPIQLNALFLENIRVPLPILIESIQTHYGQSFFYQVHKILGSADFLGNPVGLFNHIASGVLDIFYEPYQGFIINDRPQELGIGLAKGGLSFLKKTIFGFSDSFAKVTGSMAKGLAVVTLDKKFQERRRLNQRRNKPKHALYGVTSGANSFYESIASGITGIATAPIEGATSGGALGFFKGVGKGVVGFPTKTAIGIFDLASNVGEGIRNTTTVFDAEGLDKVRLPRHISYEGIVKPYSAREAQGRHWLDAIDGGIYFNEDYLAHLLLSGEEKAVVVTFKVLILFEVHNLKTSWVINYDQIKAITVEATGISIDLKRVAGPFLPIPEKENRSFLYSKISIAVVEYNKHCQVVL